MKHLEKYEIFESSFKNETTSPGAQEWVYNFFKSMENRFNNFGDFYKKNLAVKTTGGGTIDTGLGWAISKAGGATFNILSKIFEPSKFANMSGNGILGKGVSKESDVKPEHHRLLSDTFVKKDLPGIKNDDQMRDYIFNFYKNIGVPPGSNKLADDVASNYATSYYNKRKLSGGVF